MSLDYTDWSEWDSPVQCGNYTEVRKRTCMKDNETEPVEGKYCKERFNDTGVNDTQHLVGNISCYSKLFYILFIFIYQYIYIYYTCVHNHTHPYILITL